MELFHTPEQALQWADANRDRTVGLVPTMGALHEGHLSLVRQAKRDCRLCCATIFVNPTQFAEGEDLGKYPRTLDADLAGLADAGCDAVFLPTAEQIYPPGFSTYVQPPQVASGWESSSRPTHFRGVATVVLKLFHLVPTSHAFFGQKDYQQLCVIRAMSRDLNLPVQVVGCPIIRESDGLAMSSRNRYLDSDQRLRARLLSLALAQADQAIENGVHDVQTLQQLMTQTLSAGTVVDAGGATATVPGIPVGGVDSIDYAVLLDADTLQPIEHLQQPFVGLIAARFGSTRLLDNRVWQPVR